MAAITASAPVACVASVQAAAKTSRSAAPARMMGMKSAKGLPALFVKPTSAQKFGAMARSARKVTSSRKVQTNASMVPMEVAEVANLSAEIAQTSVICFIITLVGLAVGFVLLRVEAIVESD
eukprot:CAMPEP_0118927698 /NCGR_PEP_ID=MMETSP1169-20130426/5118_1 /TAXON_ID=36882 /ORGANISM="Pyramimonas obovata, Strain CCMP722" /LENGTH=121 /DNA_ID=CAMNT_0006869521 /DNA_START=82 /DNA_END=447 /DNA_ORIENTATION=+